MKQADDLMRALPATMRDQFAKSSQKWDSPTVVALRYGNTAELAKLSDEAKRLALVADNAKQTAREVFDLHFRSHADQTMTRDAALIRSAKFAKAKLDGLEAQMNRALEGAEERAAALKARLDMASAPPSNPGQAMIDAELRARVAKMNPGAVHEAMKDPVVQRAVASAPALLSGLPNESWQHVRRQHLQRVAGEDLEALDDLIAALNSADQAVKAARDHAGSFIDWEQVELLQSRVLE